MDPLLSTGTATACLLVAAMACRIDRHRRNGNYRRADWYRDRLRRAGLAVTIDRNGVSVESPVLGWSDTRVEGKTVSLQVPDAYQDHIEGHRS